MIPIFRFIKKSLNKFFYSYVPVVGQSRKNDNDEVYVLPKEVFGSYVLKSRTEFDIVIVLFGCCIWLNYSSKLGLSVPKRKLQVTELLRAESPASKLPWLSFPSSYWYEKPVIG